MKKYFECAGAAKMCSVFDEKRRASRTISLRENDAMRIASVHAGFAHIEIDRRSRRRTGWQTSHSRSEVMRGTRHRVAQLDARFFLDYFFR
jgi:hypothetical protein